VERHEDAGGVVTLHLPSDGQDEIAGSDRTRDDASCFKPRFAAFEWMGRVM